MHDSLKQTFIQALVVTVIAVNMMLIGILVARYQVESGGAKPVLGPPEPSALHPEYRMEYEGVSHEGEWKVEHYRTVEFLLDPQGNEVRARPTGEETHLRYWAGDPPE